MINFGVIGAGTIANTFSDALNGMGIKPYAIASRDYKKAVLFQEKHGYVVAYGSYETMLEDPMIDCVYISTPHALHYEHMLLSLSYGKHVLCEKPFTLNEKQARHVFEYAKEKNLFVMEAMWTRFLPVIKSVLKNVLEGIIGDLLEVNTQFSFDLRGKPLKDRMFNMHMGAGALLDIGVYNLNFSYMFLGLPTHISSDVTLHENGMDESERITFEYPNQKANMYVSLAENKPADGWIKGTKGIIKVYDFYRSEHAEIYDLKGNILKTIDHKHLVNGFEYEILEVQNCILNGKLQSEIMSPEESLIIMHLMDQLRSDWQLKYPNE